MTSGPPPRTTETLAFSPALGRACVIGFAFAFLVAIVVALLIPRPPLIEILFLGTVIAALAIRLLLRITLLRFDETENGPWFIRATTTCAGFPLASRIAPRSQIEITKKYHGPETNGAPLDSSETFWSEVTLTDSTTGQNKPFFSRWEVFLFGHARLVQVMERFL